MRYFKHSWLMRNRPIFINRWLHIINDVEAGRTAILRRRLWSIGERNDRTGHGSGWTSRRSHNFVSFWREHCPAQSGGLWGRFWRRHRGSGQQIHLSGLSGRLASANPDKMRPSILQIVLQRKRSVSFEWDWASHSCIYKHLYTRRS